MTKTIYTLGYAQWSLDEVAAQLDALDAVLVDVRRSPHTTKPGFAKPDLEARFGDRYVHLPAFGNVNYKDGPVELADPEQGLTTLQGVQRPPVLMCGCQHPEQCHRSTVSRLVADQNGASVTHLRAPSERAQPGLFDDPEG
jgi:uncharacterized protein (DUF488 family)